MRLQALRVFILFFFSPFLFLLLTFCRIFVLISRSNDPVWEALWCRYHRKDLFLLQNEIFKWCQFWSEVVTSEVEQWPTIVTAGTAINGLINLLFNICCEGYFNLDYTVTLLSYYFNLPCRWTTDKVMLKGRYFIIGKFHIYWPFPVWLHQFHEIIFISSSFYSIC